MAAAAGFELGLGRRRVIRLARGRARCLDRDGPSVGPLDGLAWPSSNYLLGASKESLSQCVCVGWLVAGRPTWRACRLWWLRGGSLSCSCMLAGLQRWRWTPWTPPLPLPTARGKSIIYPCEREKQPPVPSGAGNVAIKLLADIHSFAGGNMIDEWPI